MEQKAERPLKGLSAHNEAVTSDLFHGIARV